MSSIKRVATSALMFFVSAAAFGCERSAGAAEPEVTKVNGNVLLSVPLRVRNVRDIALPIQRCTDGTLKLRLEMRSNDEWTEILEPLCDDVARPPLEIMPAMEYVGTGVFTLSEHEVPSFDFAWLPGWFRVSVGIAAEGVADEWVVASSEFWLNAR